MIAWDDLDRLYEAATPGESWETDLDVFDDEREWHKQHEDVRHSFTFSYDPHAEVDPFPQIYSRGPQS